MERYMDIIIFINTIGIYALTFMITDHIFDSESLAPAVIGIGAGI